METHRANMPYCMGSLFWQLDDCWPVASWSTIDYYGEWKAAHYFAVKAYNNVLVSPVYSGDSVKIYGVSDLPEDQAAVLELTLMDFSGEKKWSAQDEINLKGNASAVYYAADIREMPVDDKANLLLWAALKAENGEVLSENILYFADPKDLDLPQPKIQIIAENEGGKTRVRLSSDKLAKNVFLDGNCDGWFSDNYFDLLPGVEKEVVFEPKNAGERPDIIKAISLADSYSDGGERDGGI